MTGEAESLFRAANVWGGVRNMLLLPIVAGCLETIDIHIYMAHVCFMSV